MNYLLFFLGGGGLRTPLPLSPVPSLMHRQFVLIKKNISRLNNSFKSA